MNLYIDGVQDVNFDTRAGPIDSSLDVLVIGHGDDTIGQWFSYLNCLNGYFQFPYFDALAEALVKAEGKGAIAAFSPSGLSLNDAAHAFHRALLKELLWTDHGRLGEAVLAAQATYAELGGLEEMLVIYHLFGDPALILH